MELHFHGDRIWQGRTNFGCQNWSGGTVFGGGPIFSLQDNEGNATKRKAILLSSIGADAYRILKDICFPAVPTEKTYAALASELKKHFKPKRLAVAEWFRFNTVQQQQQGQTIAEFVAQLKSYLLIVNTREISLRKVYEIDLFVDYARKVYKRSF